MSELVRTPRQVIGISDTGVDVRSCFFSDAAVALPTCMGEGFVTTPGCIDPRHRKIVTYVSEPRP
jgi:hypothetical protein